ncbi:hypothetical protein J3R03_001247 [Actinoplanes couchii]|nr:hypothetical protein [Actinoplanes couchii]
MAAPRRVNGPGRRCAGLVVGSGPLGRRRSQRRSGWCGGAGERVERCRSGRVVVFRVVCLPLVGVVAVVPGEADVALVPFGLVPAG